MAVPPELVEQRLCRRIERNGRRLRLELGQVGGDLPGQRFGDGLCGRLAHAGNALQTPGGGQLGQLRLRISVRSAVAAWRKARTL